MKTSSLLSGTFLAFVACGIAFAGESTDFVAHEWGTFTSVQGGDGTQLSWRAWQSSELPDFVYSGRNPGVAGRAPSFPGGKLAMAVLQRMETPVIYFYNRSIQPVAVNTTVRFPLGIITEWYPQATQIGPCFATNAFSVSDSRAVWNNIQIAGTKAGQADADIRLPIDQSGSHYFAARETDSALLRVPSISAADVIEQEKFLFYRGIGFFSAPLGVQMSGDDVVTVTNTGSEVLKHLFVLNIHNGRGSFEYLHSLNAAERRTVPLPASKAELSLDRLIGEMQQQMAAALASEGLYPREAAAMVNTWKDSWFTEEGTRVLYLLPRGWTDRILPLSLTPEPKDLVRIMVGRAEILSPGLEHKLHEDLVEASRGNADAHTAVSAQLKRLGRFAEPALALASQNLDAKASGTVPSFLAALQTDAPK